MAAFPGLSDAKLLGLARRWFDEGEGELLLNYDPGLRHNIEATAGQPAPDMWPLFDALAGIPTAGVFSGAVERVSDEQAAASGATPGEPADPCYHQACDDLDNVDLALARLLTAALADVTLRVADDPGLLTAAGGSS